MGLFAEVEGNIVGAIWVHIMDDYGHINEKTPSLAMSVFKNHRGKGIGTSLLKQLILLEKESGYFNLSLSVQKDNYAFKMYQKAGFRIINETSEKYIMIIDL